MGCASNGAPCTGCGLRARALRGDPAARMMLERGGGQTIGKLLPTFVTPGSVRDLKARLAPLFDATDRDVKACAALDARERAAWDGFYASWLAYRGAEGTFWGVTAEYDSGILFEASLREWQAQLETKCKLSAPKVKPPETDGDVSEVATAAKVVAGAVIVVAVVYGIKVLLP